MVSAVTDVRLEVLTIHDPLNHFDHLQDRGRRFRAKVERLAPNAFVFEAFRGAHVSTGHILDVNIVAYIASVASNYRPFPPQKRADGSRHETTPVEVPSAIDVPAPHDHERQGVGMVIRSSDEVGTTFGDFVRIPA